MALGSDAWKSVINGYKAPENPPTDQAGKKANEQNARSMNVILNGLT